MDDESHTHCDTGSACGPESPDGGDSNTHYVCITNLQLLITTYSDYNDDAILNTHFSALLYWLQMEGRIGT